MRNLYKRLKTDAAAEENGRPVDFGEGLVLNIRAARSKVLRALEDQIAKRNRQYFRNGVTVPADVQDTDNIDRATAMISGFVSGVTDETGRELPFSEANARKIVTDLVELREMVINSAVMHETYRAEELKLVAENLSPASASGSSTPAVAAQSE